MKNQLFLYIALTLLTLYPFHNGQAKAPSLKGSVYGLSSTGKQELLEFAGVFWAASGKPVMTDAKGQFTIERPSGNGTHKLIASFTGYNSDTLSVGQNAEEVTFVLTEGEMLEGASIQARQQGSFISKLTPVKMEVITVEGLSKMACCTLAESFENTATVSVGYSDAVSGARQIRMLGLAGIYTQMLDENIPTSIGLASTYGLSNIPGPWLESIQISKGPTSVINGYESIAGQINMEHKKPDRSEPLYVNLFASSDERYEGNITSAVKLNDRLSTIVFVHGSADTKLHDENNDGFADMPKSRQINVGNRWLYKGDNVQLRFGIGYLNETRDGGQVNHGSASAMPLYQTAIDNQHFNAYTKIGIPFNRDETSLGIIVSYSYHDENAVYGEQMQGGKGKAFGGNENNLFTNLIFQSSFGAQKQHKYSLGAGFRYDQLTALYTDNLQLYNAGQAIDFGHDEATTGAFAEYTYSPGEHLSIIAGARLDYNNIYGVLFTPRAHLKYNFLEHSSLRAAIGRGYRSAYLIPDNMGILANSRTLSVDPKDLDIEEAWTYGISFTQTFPMTGNRQASLSIDAFRSDFSKQVVVDREVDASGIYVHNLNGNSYANSFQVDFTIEPVQRFTILTTFRYTDSKITMSHGTVEKPLTDRYKGLINLSYATKFEKWKFDFTAQLNGESRIPTLDGDIAHSTYSEVYPMFFAQVTKKFRRLDLYAGCENIGNFMQDDPIIDSGNPFGKDFDASIIWGPLMGRKFYIGLRLKFGEIL